MPAPGAYRALLRATGPSFLILAFAARLPNGMGPLGILTLVAGTSGSYGLAGVAAGAFGLGSAAGGPAVGWLADRFGQRRTGLVAAVLNAAAFAGTVASSAQHLAAPVIVGFATLAGLSTPQVGPFMRSRWVSLLSDLPAGGGASTGRERPAGDASPRFPDAAVAYRRSPQLLATAFSYEGAVDEVSYVAGPALVGLLAFTTSAVVPLLLAALLVLAAGAGFAVHRSAVPARAVPHRGHARAPLPGRSVVWLVLGMVALGVVLGGVQTAVSVLARSVGESGAGGVVYAALGLTSATAGMATAWLPRAFGLSRRYLGAGALLAAACLALPAVQSVAAAAVVLAVLGLWVGPFLVTGYGLAERVAPRQRGGLVMTLLASGIMAGVAAGSSAAGLVADGYGFVGAFWVPVAGGGAALLVALGAVRQLHRESGTPPVERLPQLTHA